MVAVVQLEKLTKSYGEHRGIIDVDLGVEAGEVFGFLGPNGAGKTTTIRTMLDLIRPTSGRALVFGIESNGRPGGHPPTRRLHPGRVRALRPTDRRPAPRVLRQPARRRGRGLPGLAHRAPRPGPRPALQGVQQGQQAEGRARHRPAAPPGAARPRRADLRPRPARPADLLRHPRRRPWRRVPRSSSRATSSARSRRAASAWPSSARAAWSRWTPSTPCATSPTTRWSCASRATSPGPPSRRCPASAMSSSTTTSCGCGSPGPSRRSSRPPHATSCSTSSAASRAWRRPSWRSTAARPSRCS